jgi:ketosteroid isomerase-like protein
MGLRIEGETMTFSRRHIAVAGASMLCSSAFGASSALAAASGGEADVAAAVEAFRKAMLANDRKQFEALCAEQLSYGHSSGRVQTQKEFIDEASSGKTTWKSITLTDQTIQLAGSAAVVRFVFNGENVSDGKTNTVKIGVLMVWVKERGKWRLLARQGYKI